MSDNSVFCRECNAKNPASNKFCSNCGASLKPATHITCPNCYHRNPLHLLYCDNCGTRLVRETPLDAEPEADETQPLSIPTGFSLPSRSPGETADLDPDSLPDWLKTGGDGGGSNQDQTDDWFDELKTSSLSGSSSDNDFLDLDSDLGSVSLDWLADDPADHAAVDEDDEDDFDLFEDDSAEQEQTTAADTDDFTLTGIVHPKKEGEDFDWLSVMGEMDTDEPPVESPPTGFTGLLSPDALKAFEEQNFEAQEPAVTADDLAQADEMFLFDEEGEEEGQNQETAEFTDWLQQTTIETDAEPAATADIPDWLTPPGGVEETAAAGDDSWLTALESNEDDEPLELDVDSGSDESVLPDWLSAPQTGPLAQGGSGSTGFTGWLSSQSIDDFESRQMGQESTKPTAEEASDVPDWLQTPPEEEKEGGTGFTDWLMESEAHASAEDDDEHEFDDEDDFDWLDEEKTQELMKPLTTEEAEKLLENTPDVSDDFIKEVVGGDFPDWLTDVENVGDPGDTGVLPAWISAPVSESDTLTLGLGRDMPLPKHGDDDDNWLADLAGPTGSGDENDWFADLATSTAAADDNFAIGSELEQEEDIDSADDDWLAEMPGVSDSSAAVAGDEGDDWLAEMPGLGHENAPSENLEELFEGLPPFDDTSAYNNEALNDLFGELEEGDEAAADDWLAEMPDQEEQDAVGWMSTFGSLDSGAGKATAALEWLHEPLDDQNEAPLSLEDTEEPKDPTYIDPAFDLASFAEESAETVDEGGDSGELDWLSMIESTTGEHTAVVESPAEEDAAAWLMGADLEDESSGTYVIDEDLRAVVFKEEEEDSEPYEGEDTDTLGDSWERDLLTPILEEDTEDILQELRALRTTDRLDPNVVEEVRQDEADPEIAEFINQKEIPAVPAVTPNWIKDGDDTLTNWVIDPFEREEPLIQKGGPLDGLKGVVTIAPVISAAPPATQTGSSLATLTVSEAHQQHAALLRQLTRAEWRPQPTADAKSRQVPARNRSMALIQLAVGLIIIAAILIGLLLPDLLPTTLPPVSPEVGQLNTALNSLSDQTVLVAFEYSPAFAGELNPQARLFLEELAQNGNNVLLMSQYPTGMANARPVVAAVNGLESTEVGYIPGEALGLREIAACLEQATCQTAAGRQIALGEVGALVILTGERDSLINWLEQVEPQTTVPVMVGVTEALSPLAQPYVVSAQIDGLLTGLPAAAAYEQAYQSDNTLNRLFQAQSLAKIVALIIIISGVIMALLSKKSATTE